MGKLFFDGYVHIAQHAAQLAQQAFADGGMVIGKIKAVGIAVLLAQKGKAIRPRHRGDHAVDLLQAAVVALPGFRSLPG